MSMRIERMIEVYLSTWQNILIYQYIRDIMFV